MRIIFSNHAEVKISQRRVPKSYIIKTLSAPDIIHHNPKGRDKYYKKFIKLHLRVVARKLKARIIVITVHWVAKIPNKE